MSCCNKFAKMCHNCTFLLVLFLLSIDLLHIEIVWPERSLVYRAFSCLLLTLCFFSRADLPLLSRVHVRRESLSISQCHLCMCVSVSYESGSPSLMGKSPVFSPPSPFPPHSQLPIEVPFQFGVCLSVSLFVCFYVFMFSLCLLQCTLYVYVYVFLRCFFWTGAIFCSTWYWHELLCITGNSSERMILLVNPGWRIFLQYHFSSCETTDDLRMKKCKKK